MARERVPNQWPSWQNRIIPYQEEAPMVTASRCRQAKPCPERERSKLACLYHHTQWHHAQLVERGGGGEGGAPKWSWGGRGREGAVPQGQFSQVYVLSSAV